MTQTIDDTLAERGSRYGEFPDHAFLTQELKATMHDHNGWAELDDDMKECLDMVAHKIGRIINGDPTYIDSWTDIIGYTRLVEKRLINEQTPPSASKIESILESLARIKAEQDAKNAKPCSDPRCTTCNPALADAINVLRKAGIVVEVSNDEDDGSDT